MPEAGLEPARCFHRGILSPLRLPIPPLGQVDFIRFMAFFLLKTAVFIFGGEISTLGTFFRKIPCVCIKVIKTYMRRILSPLRLPIPPQRLDFQKQSNNSAALFPKHFKSIAKRAANVNDFRPLTQKKS